jgi:hypothetical protein
MVNLLQPDAMLNSIINKYTGKRLPKFQKLRKSKNYTFCHCVAWQSRTIHSRQCILSMQSSRLLRSILTYNDNVFYFVPGTYCHEIKRHFTPFSHTTQVALRENLPDGVGVIHDIKQE